MAAWARELGIAYAPSQVFFDGAGQEVLRTKAYLRPFHIHSGLAYGASGAYQQEPEF